MPRFQGDSIPPDPSLIVAHDLTSGALLWTVDLPMDLPGDTLNQVIGMRDGRVYASRLNVHPINPSYVYALNAADGAILWRSEALIREVAPGMAAFAPNGDLIIGNFYTLVRIRATDGTTVWEVERQCLIGGGCSAAVFGNKAYAWGRESTSPANEISAFDLDTGVLLYQAPPTGLASWQTLPFVGPDGTVYAPKVGNPAGALIAYEDTGTALVEKWRVPFGNQPLASFGVGPDGSVYSYSRDQRIIRLDPATGTILNSSQTLNDATIIPHMLIDASGNLFVVNSYLTSMLYSFNPNLTLRWSMHIPNVHGLALGQNGILVVPGNYTDVYAFQSTLLLDYRKPGCRVQTIPAGITLTIQDVGRGLAEIIVLSQENVTVDIPAFEPGTTQPVIVTATLIPPHLNGSVQLRASDAAGNSVRCNQSVGVEE